jgi:hypothetical protein
MAAQLDESSKPTLAESVVTPFHRDSSFQPLTGHDRCDCSAVEGDQTGVHLGSCGAEARVRVTMTTGSQIVFCGHHFAQHGPKITEAAMVYDEREQVEFHFSPTGITEWDPLVSAE